MPWCKQCDRFLSPPSVKPDGTCPTCETTVDPGRAGATAGVDAEDSPPIPWHLKALVAALVLYLGWRAFEGVEWLAARF